MSFSEAIKLGLWQSSGGMKSILLSWRCNSVKFSYLLQSQFRETHIFDFEGSGWGNDGNSLYDKSKISNFFNDKILVSNRFNFRSRNLKTIKLLGNSVFHEVKFLLASIINFVLGFVTSDVEAAVKVSDIG